jgi:cytochrome c-type biogenesis protein CcmE
MIKNAKFVVGIVLIVGAIGYLIASAVKSTSEYYLTVNEVQGRLSELQDETFRVAGRVEPGTISWDAQTLTLAFAITSLPKEAAKATAPSDPVSFRVISRGEPKPDMFAANRDVIVEGRFGRGGVIEASQVLTKCPSKYIPEHGEKQVSDAAAR